MMMNNKVFWASGIQRKWKVKPSKFILKENARNGR